MRPFFTPRTSASDRSMRPPSVILLSMVVGPPATWTPVYVVLSSWKRTRSAAVVAVSDGPAAAATISWSFSTATRFVAAASSSRSRLPTPNVLSADGRVSVPTSAPTPTRCNDADASMSTAPFAAGVTSTCASPIDVSISHASERRFLPGASGRLVDPAFGAATPIFPRMSSVNAMPLASSAFRRVMMDSRAPAASNSDKA
mmetsp:Transcript_10379/g.31372  ORF Transcript_10379/g.31372 Transcript_10379/m.31372 type:complete len:201 (+) Transcript_10379:124-726(+)